jgi:hypothetical protein
MPSGLSARLSRRPRARESDCTRPVLAGPGAPPAPRGLAGRLPAGWETVIVLPPVPGLRARSAYGRIASPCGARVKRSHGRDNNWYFIFCISILNAGMPARFAKRDPGSRDRGVRLASEAPAPMEAALGLVARRTSGWRRGSGEARSARFGRGSRRQWWWSSSASSWQCSFGQSCCDAQYGRSNDLSSINFAL